MNAIWERFRNFPVGSTSFVGRGKEIAEIVASLHDSERRIVTLVGPGGMGKTRLAIEVAKQFVEQGSLSPFPEDTRFADGLFFVPLAAITTPKNIVNAIANATGYPMQSDGRAPRQQVLDFLRMKSMLLVLDNFEHLLEGTDLVADILQSAPDVNILVTSREVLNLQSEWVWRLRGLAFPNNAENSHLEEYSAVQLFAERARQIRGDFALKESSPAVIQICRLVEGMPLAIELAAAWVEILTPDEIAQEITQNLNILTSQKRDLPQRHRNIEAVFESTWQRLSEREQSVFMKFAIFRGGCTRRAAQSVTGTDLPTLQSLFNKSLLRRGGEDRYEMHELLRQFAEMKLENAELVNETREIHSKYYAEAVHALEAALDDHRQLEALNDIDSDLENVVVAWEWGLQNQHYDRLYHMADSLHRLLIMRRNRNEVIILFERTLENLETKSGGTQRPLFGRLIARMNFHVAWGLSQHLSFDERINWGRISCEIAREYDDPYELAHSLLLLGLWLTYEQPDEAMKWVQESLAISRTINHRRNEADCLLNVGEILRNDPDVYLRHIQEALAIYRELEQPAGIASSLCNLGLFHWNKMQLVEAEAVYRESLMAYQGIGTVGFDLKIIQALATVAYLKGDFLQTQQYAEEAITIASSKGQVGEQVVHLALLGRCALVRGDYDLARDYAHESFTLSQRLDPRYCLVDIRFLQLLLGGAQLLLGEALLGQGHIEEAMTNFIEGFKQILVDSRHDLSDSVRMMSYVLAYQGQPVRALEIVSLVIHNRHSPAWLQDKHPLVQKLLAELKDTLAPTEYKAAWERGKTLDLEAVAQKLKAEFSDTADEAPPDPVQAANQALIEPLTPRELEILSHISSGLSNHEIAEQLFVVKDTVKKHITHLYGKLGVKNRVQAITHARELKLLDLAPLWWRVKLSKQSVPRIDLD